MPKTSPQVDDIVADVLAADPSLAGREAELRGIVTQLLASKPDTRFDAAFAAKLRDLLTERHAADTVRATRNAKPSFLESMKNKPLFMALSGGAVLSLLLIAVLVNPNKTAAPGSTQNGEISDVAVGELATIQGNGFGSLVGGVPSAVSARPGTAVPMAVGDESAPVRNQSGGGGGGVAMAVPAPTQMLGSDAAMSSKMMVPVDYVPTNYRYVFNGELDLSGDDVFVYRHVKGLTADTSFGQFSGMLRGLMNAAKFSNGRVQNVSFVEDRPYGYYMNIDAIEGSISLSSNWQRWPHPESSCTDEACFQRYQIRPDDMPADEELIDIADAFMNEYGIGHDRLGDPVVQLQDYRIMLAAATDRTSIYAPASVSVVYPLNLDGQNVTDESGNSFGVSVNVNVRERKVDGMWGLTTNRYERSGYAAATDAQAILKFVEAGAGTQWNDPNATKTVDIELGNPEKILSRYWRTTPEGVGEELYVPMLRFPVLNPPADQPWFRKAILVPLAQELLDAQISGQNGGQPMPLIMMKGSDGAATDPAVTTTEPAVMMDLAQ